MAAKLGFPVLQEQGATFIRAFADDVVALFDDCYRAVGASLEIHRRIGLHNRSGEKHQTPPECCIGIGYGAIYEIGPNHAMGDEMNRASVLGEDVARGGETLVTEQVHLAVPKLHDATFEPQTSDDLLFPYYRVTSRG
jgi:class 3 adenylate cyclase